MSLCKVHNCKSLIELNDLKTNYFTDGSEKKTEMTVLHHGIT